MLRIPYLCWVAVIATLPVVASAQMTYRLKGTVKDQAGKPVENATIHAEALTGFRGEQFVGQKQFSATTNAKGEWTILGLTSGIWTFEVTQPDVVPHVVVLPINFTNRKPQSASGGSFSWDLPLWVQRTTHAGLRGAAAAATERRIADTASAVGVLAGEKDSAVLCSAGEIALLVRQHGLARAIFTELNKQDAKSACATRGIASAALMQNDLDAASKMLWSAIELVPREQRAALGAAIKDLQQISGTK
ncbi:MAG TPA: carboxypeptidase-like regulatory domain-containing protein [Vicinamibacterales bacterium]|nr:carboxypeptidase-like regulatory domain-containing protein [Vicinamibacterales bacterium]